MKLAKRAVCLALALFTVMTVLLSSIPVSAQNVLIQDKLPEGYKGVNITRHEGSYEWQNGIKYTYKFDFSMTRKSYYTIHEALSVENEENMIVDDGTLRVEDGKTLMFGSSVGLGDDYGLEKGYASFDLCLNGGTVNVGVRTSETGVTNEARGLWFAIDGSGSVKISEPECGLEATVNFDCDFSSAKNVKVCENVDSIVLECDGRTVAKVSYDKKGKLEVFDASGNSVASTDECKLYTSGYVQLYIEGLDGYIDNFEFTHVDLDNTLYTDGSLREIDYSTWVATDDLGRTLALNESAGDVKEDKYVGVFYFLCWVGAGQTVQDNTKLYLNEGIRGLKDYFDKKKGGEAYWAEPYFGYYRNTDAWVYRKHAYMLEAAGVDFIFLDVSNAEVFINGHMTLFDTWLKIRQEGGMTPQIMFMTGDNSATFESDMKTLFTTVYSDDNWEKYEELFFCVDGKPLVFGNISGVSEEMAAKINEKFTVRGCWAWTDKDGYWSWLQEYTYDERTGTYGLVNGGWGRDLQGNPEALAISMGHHPTTSKGRSFVYGEQPNNGKGDYEFSSVERAGQGLNFESQFKAAKALDPTYLLITGWNEWIAGCYYENSRVPFANSTATFSYVDQFNCEFSRDGEPMRNVDGYGIGDNYYYQMADYIRQFKGIKETPKADNQQTVDLYDVKEWNNISLEYRDNIGDTELRNTVCYDDSYRYINNSGRNDFDYAKVSQDSDYMYFMVKCVNDIVIDNGTNWMNLYINTDSDISTGWGGYDYAINRDRDSYVVSVEKFKDNTWEGEIVGVAEYYLEGKYMVVKIPKAMLGLDGTANELLFKWADNSTDDGDLMEFMDTGDAAPNDRYSFVYRTDSCSDDKFDKSQTPEIQEPVINRPSREPETGYEVDENGYRDVNISLDFEDVSSGADIKSTSAVEVFEFKEGTSSSIARIVNENGNNYVNHTGYADLRTWYDIQGSYTFSVDLKLVDTGNSAVYVRGEMPGIFTPYNPAHSNAAGQEVYQVLNYYEWDWYAENGGKEGASSVAGSGIGLYPGEDSLLIKIKRYVTDGITVASKDVVVNYPDGMTLGDEFFNLKVTDDGQRVEIYINDTFIAYLILENPGVSYESDGTDSEYYGKVSVFSADDENLLELENTRLNSKGSQIAITTRQQTIIYDNIDISFKEKAPETPDSSGEKLTVKGEDTDFTPDTRLTDLYYGQEIDSFETDTGNIQEGSGESQSTAGTGESGCREGCKSSGSGACLMFAAVGCAVLSGIFGNIRRRGKD